jgi:hypothetical protein
MTQDRSTTPPRLETAQDIADVIETIRIERVGGLDAADLIALHQLALKGLSHASAPPAIRETTMSDKPLKHYRDALNTWNKQLNYTYDGLQLAALMAVLDELKALNRLFGCANVLKGFRALSKIAARDEKAFKRRVEHAVAKRVKRAT